MALSPPGGEIEGDSHAELVPALEGLAEEIGYPVAYSDELERAAGLCDRRARRITIRAGMAPNRTAAVLIHELGHALVAEVHAAALPAALEELAVESVAFVVSAAAGLDVSCEAVPYVASFGGEDAVEELELPRDSTTWSRSSTRPRSTSAAPARRRAGDRSTSCWPRA